MTGFTSFIGTFVQGPLDKATPVRSFTEFAEVFGGLDEASEASYQVSQFFLNGGAAASVVRVTSEDVAVESFEALDPEADLLCIPDLRDLQAVAAAQLWCERHRCFYLVDPPGELATPGQLVSWVEANKVLLGSGNAALAWPQVLVENSLNENLPRVSASSGTIAGIYAANDAARGVWDAPAGLHAPLVCAGLAYTMNDQENALLTARGINAIRRFPTHGIVLWGARTLSPETVYVPVKRTEIFIERELRSSRLGSGIEEFLNGLWLQGALMGSRAEDAYFVSAETVGVALARPAEFVVLQRSN